MASELDFIGLGSVITLLGSESVSCGGRSLNGLFRCSCYRVSRVHSYTY